MIETPRGSLFAAMTAKLVEGISSGSRDTMDPHWQHDPVGWAERFMNINPRTLRWSLNPGYEDHVWDGTADPLATVLESLARGKNVGVESGTGTGKAQPVDEPVLTPTGWRPIGSLRPGDYVVDARGRPTRVIGVYPQGTKPIYELLFNDGASTRSCDEHLWAVRTRKDKHTGRDFRVLPLSDVRKQLHREWQIPVPAAIEHDETTLSIDPYVLGVLLGDGSITTSSLTFSTKDPFIVEEMTRLSGVSVTKRSGDDITWGLSTERGKENPILTALRDLDLHGRTSHEKFIPEAYLFGSVQQRLALMQGLMDADGSVDKKNGCTEFATTSPTLAEDVRALARSLGGTATLSVEHAYLNGVRYRDRHRVMVKLPNGLVPFRLPRKTQYVKDRTKYPVTRILRGVRPVGEAECVCIAVESPDHLYVTKDYIVTHNTFLGALVCLWFVSCFKNALVVTSAPKEAQLLLHLWKELQRNWPKFQGIFPDAALTKLLVKMNPPNMDWIVTGFACGVGADEQSATKAQGFHAEHMLIITEETPGIHQAVMTAFENTCTGDHNLRLAFGNPDHEEDALHKFCTKANVVHVRISSLDHPNVVTGTTIVPGAVSKRNIEERRIEYGEDSPIYKSRVRGLCPTEASTALIKRAWCRAAVDKYGDDDLRKGVAAMGVDVANSPKGDLGAIARGIGAVCLEVNAFPCPDANKLGFRVALEMGAHGVDERNVGVDGVGVGAGTVNELLRLRYNVAVLLGSASPLVHPEQSEQFGNLRAQMHWKARQDLQHGRIGIPDDEELILDLTTPLWFIRNGKIWVEAKEDIKKRLGRSPNKGDAFIYWNWVREPIQGGATAGARIITLS